MLDRPASPECLLFYRAFVLTKNPSPTTILSHSGGVAEWSNAPVLKTGSTHQKIPVPTVFSDATNKCLSPSLSVAIEKFPELSELILVWPTLPADVRSVITGLIKLTPTPQPRDSRRKSNRFI